MAAVRHLGFLKFKFLTVVAVKNPILIHHTKFCTDRSNRCGDISIFVIFKMAAEIRNFNGHSAVRGQYESLRQISSKSVKRLPRYGDLTVFKMAPVRHLGF